jgi:hypothetical protein
MIGSPRFMNEGDPARTIEFRKSYSIPYKMRDETRMIKLIKGPVKERTEMHII